MRFSTVYSNGDRGIGGGTGSRAIGNSIRSNSGLGRQLGEGGAYRENMLTLNNGGMETQVGVAAVTDTIFTFDSNVCGTDSVCP